MDQPVETTQDGGVSAAPKLVTTTVALWAPAVRVLRGGDGGARGEVLRVVVAALDHPGCRWPIPAPRADLLERLVDAGQRFNAVVRPAHHRPGEVDESDLGPVIAEVMQTAAACTASVPAVVAPREPLCVGRLSAVVNIGTSTEMMGCLRDAAALNRMRFSVWIRDAVAGSLGEHARRRPAEQSARAVEVVWRIGGLLTQSAYLDVCATEDLVAVEAALAELDSRLVHCGVGR